MRKLFFTTFLALCLCFLSGCIVFVKVEGNVEIVEAKIPTEVTAEDFDITSLSLKVVLDNGDITQVGVTEDMIVSPSLEELKTPGEYTVKILYKDAYLEFKITLLEKYYDVTVNYYLDDNVYQNISLPRYNTLTHLPVVSKEGYCFKGWYYEPWFVNEVTLDDEISDNTNLYAKFVPYGNKITFDFNQDNVEDYIQIVGTGDLILLFFEPTREGYTFEGWYESSSFSGESFDFNQVIKKDIKLYAKWTIK